MAITNIKKCPMSIFIVILIMFSPRPSIITHFKIISHIKAENMQWHELEHKLSINFLLHKQYMLKNGSHLNHEICKALIMPLQNTDSLWFTFLTLHNVLFLILIFIQEFFTLRLKSLTNRFTMPNPCWLCNIEQDKA